MQVRGVQGRAVVCFFGFSVGQLVGAARVAPRRGVSCGRGAGSAVRIALATFCVLALPPRSGFFGALVRRKHRLDGRKEAELAPLFADLCPDQWLKDIGDTYAGTMA